ncbi:hypothetical protein [Pseudanabaena sp. FACHB-2040]|uniref:hypothetical protein n=1 Tax=Pseudanabaena sp. FACHB-2040 TaxID=2692859 RepID=UPI001686E57F|nr:hypothetical protein [Pseudanabaena sp. FACHB-2040]MBD2261117.1 hypothetical protein [Pseudanabaena sp. FACHB-2040]
MSTKPRLGGMKLGQFGGVRSQSAQEEGQETQPAAEPKLEERQEILPPPIEPVTPAAAVATPVKPKAKAKHKPPDKLTNVNIKINRNQQRWLQDTAQQIRDNNSKPVPPDQRVYPQHLIGIAIDLLKAQDVDWSEVRNADELRNRLNI